MKRRRPFYLYLLLLIPLVTLLFLLFSQHSQNSPRAEKLLNLLDWKNESITLEAVLSGKFYANSFNGSWVDGNNLQYFINGDLVQFKIDEGKTRLILRNEEFYSLIGHRPYKAELSPVRDLNVIIF